MNAVEEVVSSYLTLTLHEHAMLLQPVGNGQAIAAAPCSRHMGSCLQGRYAVFTIQKHGSCSQVAACL